MIGSTLQWLPDAQPESLQIFTTESFETIINGFLDVNYFCKAVHPRCFQGS